MPAAAIVSLVLVALLVVALAGYLISVVLLLRRIVDALGKITFGVRAIAHRAQPIGGLLDEVNADLDSVARTLDALVARDEPARTGTPQ